MGRIRDANLRKVALTSSKSDWSGGDRDAPERLMPFVYDELRRLARSFIVRERGGWRSRGAGETAAANLPTEDDARPAGEKYSARTFVSPELKNIVAMARHEDAARRYGSAAQLAEDVQRYLDGLPVRAQKDSFTYRAGKFVRRNRAGVAAAALVALALVVGLAAALWQAGVAYAAGRGS